jgi:uncharacterized iron-regulated membrane protein
MSIKIDSKTVKSGFKAHSCLGLFSAALLYLISVSGILSVFYQEFDRWEQPDIPEYQQFSPEHMSSSIEKYIALLGKTPERIYIVLPTEGFPRTHITDGIDEWYLDSNGEFKDAPEVPWTMMVRELHGHLLLPHIIGMSLVGLMGVLCLALIISGVIAHPSIFKDAFLWRAGKKTLRIQQMDLHNRIGVWGLPFHFMMAFTGAFMGLGAVLMTLTSIVMFSGDPEDVTDAIYGQDPVMEQQALNVNFQQAFITLKEKQPEVNPIYIVLHKAGTSEQLLEIAATAPGRLVYSELYRFNANGTWLNQQGLITGAIGGQIAYSTYRLHFGHFHSNWVKLLYGIMGIAFTYLIVSGINIWLARRKYQTWVNSLWNGWVVGTLIAFASSCWMGLIGFNPVVIFFSTLGAVVMVSILGKGYVKVTNGFYIVLAFNILLIPIMHAMKFDFFSLNLMQYAIYTVVILLGLGLTGMTYKKYELNSRSKV